jgi:hypothetical protein
LQVCKVLQPRSQTLISSPPWESQISYKLFTVYYTLLYAFTQFCIQFALFIYTQFIHWGLFAHFASVKYFQIELRSEIQYIHI